jgi:hypothetical protein
MDFQPQKHGENRGSSSSRATWTTPEGAKCHRTERLRADLRALASDAMATLQELVSSPDVAPSVWLRASLAILQAVNALKADGAF